jgi:predicted nucleotidyltransferase
VSLDAKTEKVVAKIAERIREVFGAELVSLVLYGSAAGGDFAPTRSDLNFAIVLQRIGFAQLKALQHHLPAWRKLGAATPLLLDRIFLERACDVFPTEFLDMKAQHRVLYGEEVFATLSIDRRHLRYQSEHEARSKLLRLRALYAEVGADRKCLEALMLDSVKTFLIIMRNIVRLGGGTGHPNYLAVLEQFERHAGVSFPTMRQLLRVKLGLERDLGTLDDVFAAYLDEVERLVELVDRDLPEAAPAHQ